MSAAEYYSHGSYPATRASLSSSAMRSELELIEAGFAKLPDLSGNGGKIVAVNAGATALEAVSTGTGVLTFLATPSSANLRSAITDETGTGALVFGTNPTLVGATVSTTGVPLTVNSTNSNGNKIALQDAGAATSFLGAGGGNLLIVADSGGTNVYEFNANRLKIPGQILFPAAQNASADANTLDDYEEGTFTPTLTLGGASTGMTYAVQNGHYTKVGNAVHFRLWIALTAKGSATGSVSVGGLPFTSRSTANTQCPCAVYINGMSTLTGGVMSFVNVNSTELTVRQSGTGTSSSLTDTNITNNSDLMIAGTYFV